MQTTAAPEVMSQNVLEIRNLNFYYGSFHSLKNINLDIKENSVTAFKTIDSETFHFGAPNANAASRKLTGTKLNMFSVVRTTTGMAIKVKAKVPAQPEKCLAFTTTKA